MVVFNFLFVKDKSVKHFVIRTYMLIEPILFIGLSPFKVLEYYGSNDLSFSIFICLVHTAIVLYIMCNLIVLSLKYENTPVYKIYKKISIKIGGLK